MINVDGFLFENEETAQLAHREEEGIRFIKQRTALDNPEVVLKLYKKLLEQELFVTPVGIRFLTELQNILLTSVYIARDEIPPIPVKATEVIQKAEYAKSAETGKQQVEAGNRVENKITGDYKKPFYVATFFAVVFAVSVLGMFIINAISGNNINIINYREKILNEYSGWEAELESEAERLQNWEKSLEQREEQFRNQINNGQ